MLKALRAWLSCFMVRKGRQLMEIPPHDLHLTRLAAVRQFVYDQLPTLITNANEEAAALPVIEDAKFNYFTLPSGDIPHYHFVLPSLSLYIYVCDHLTSSWPEARELGVDRVLWEIKAEDLAYMILQTPDVSVGVEGKQSRLLVIEWNDATGIVSLTNKLRKLINMTLAESTEDE